MNDATAIALLLEDTEYGHELYETFGEIYAEYRGEIARYGDAWPGSTAQIEAGRETLLRYERDCELLNAISPPWGCHIPTPVTNDNEAF